ncbi:Uncharacterized protein JF73_17270 (plasmid) [Lactobacillus helsingborgensis]|uniref:Class III bacteriocin n=2 Tax=Lactobacillus TaxID=1578 RepID=A0AA47B5N4_9LACO|nr:MULTISPECIES: helveticin J family class III bacteriocin [Lactobacillus]KJY54717.1 Uncharacterized protein JF74_18930 [Lactobacillus melliventris]KJY60554.1 Uncharacterized protein JF73_17270 [Lactobacillus helsingborgensis]UZX30598.1 class III bacteriocin [Lactobacillus helsingborgensis]
MVEFKFKSYATHINKIKKFELDIKHHSVVQKGNIGTSFIYALQLRGQSKNIYILRGKRPKSNEEGTNFKIPMNESSPLLILKSKAGGHSETWEYSGITNKWFVGTKSSKGSSKWDTQIARIDIKNSKPVYSSNAQLTRLGYLNRAGNEKDRFAGKYMHRVEIALSPDYKKFLIASVEKNGTGHFAIYPTHCINEELDKKEGEHGLINIGDLTDKLKDPDKSEIESFTVKPFLNMYKKGKDKKTKQPIDVIRYQGNIESVQGYDLDNDGNIYITSQKSPFYDKVKKKFTTYHKQIIKIPSRSENGEKLSEEERADMSNWFAVNLSKWKKIDIAGKHSEVEGIQIIDEDHAYVTVAYHALVKGKNTTVLNVIYELNWDWVPVESVTN